MSETVRYDDALPRFAALVAARLGRETLDNHLFLRDAEGRLTFVVPEAALSNEELAGLRSAAAATLAPYVTSESGSVSTPEDLFDPSLHDSNAGFVERLNTPVFEGRVRVVERRILGQDWQVRPILTSPADARIVVFASHKGGVGRTTAMAVAAADFAARGERVLVVDLDLESPGVGEIMLSRDDTPEFGALDYFVENGLGSLDESFLSKLVGVSVLTSRDVVHVVPAVGRLSQANPQNVLGKLSSAYLEDPVSSGQPRSFLFQVRDLLGDLARRGDYSAIFVDARAGLNESTAAAVLGLGADVLLFGMDTPQTFAGYRYLLSYLQRFVSQGTQLDDDFRLRLRMVHARASADPRKQKAFRDRAFDLFAEHLYETASDAASDDPGELFNFDLDDSTAPHFAWSILDDSSYREFDPLSQPEQLTEPLYARTFGPFLAALRDRVERRA